MDRKIKMRPESSLRRIVEVVPSENSGLPGWAIVLLVVFAVLTVCTVVIVVCNCNRGRKKGCGSSDVNPGDVFVSGAAPNVLPSQSFVNRLSNKDGHCRPSVERPNLQAAFQGAMTIPPCNGQFYPGAKPSRALEAKDMNLLESQSVDKSFKYARHAQGAFNDSSSPLINNLNSAYDAARVEGYPGIMPVELRNQKMSTALHATGLEAPASPELMTAGETHRDTGFMAYGQSGYRSTKAALENTAESMDSVWQYDPSHDLSLALSDDQAAVAASAWNPANALPVSAMLSGAAIQEAQQNNKAMILAAQANPDQAASILLQAGSLQVPTMSSIQGANRALGNFRSIMSTPVLRTINLNTTALLRPATAMAAVGMNQPQFNMSVGYFEAARAATCQS